MTTLIRAHGFDVELTSTELKLLPHLLAGALGSGATVVAVDDITGVGIARAATDFDPGVVEVERSAGGALAIAFPPRGTGEQRSLVDQIEALITGDRPLPRLVPGLSFVAVDVETANEDWGSICQIGVVRFSDGDPVDSREWLCKPPAALNRFDPFNISIHGITAEKVADAPDYSDVLPEMLAFIGDLPVVAHNAQFDMTAFSRASHAAGVQVPELTFGCSLAAARHADLMIKNHKLPTVATHLGVGEFQHHDALADAKACGRIIVELARRDHKELGFAELFQDWGFSLGTLDGQRVFPVLKKPMTQGPVLTGAATEAAAVGSAWDSPAEQQEAPKKSARKPARWARAAAPDVVPEANLYADASGPLFGQVVTLTGDFEPFDKGMLWKMMAERGATIGKNVTKKTTLLVIGPWDSVTSKQKRAEELIAKGQEIAMWDEKQLFKELGLDADEQPPF